MDGVSRTSLEERKEKLGRDRYAGHVVLATAGKEEISI